ncbi:peroxiredoxin [Flavobacterium sedimenticola]|uniref:thioredoxin-dependent peroxiredoxin n=1 Tax=Flavobacterium sedimenticola TaxID=3043286 RepID=A0ABT6XRB8_9FLAO|nr:peroxiredoxin [Flavobacterium sedimenticola]MDI9257635.1 peroxiredoxin [Flavobacterium sedimenticola]
MGLQVGDTLPHFIAVDSHGNPFDSKHYDGKALVIYFYPKDDTRVCTVQACSFRDQYEDFKALGAEVIGVSSDSAKSHQKFASKYRLPFLLLSDSDKKLRKLFGVPNDLFGLLPGRVTYVIDKKGIVQLVFNSMSGKIHIQKALQMLKTM